jgi:hypothetical protein
MLIFVYMSIYIVHRESSIELRTKTINLIGKTYRQFGEGYKANHTRVQDKNKPEMETCRKDLKNNNCTLEHSYKPVRMYRR